jgi:adenosylmethionine-8-amino-7-oxononanoate aminotransferase
MFGKDSRCVISDYNLDMITNDLCAVIVETSSWQNGLHDPGKAFWVGLRNKCTEMGIVLILDDIAMCGGKTGNFVGWKNNNGEVLVEPDIFTMGKALTGGYFPLSACLANETIFNKIKNNLWCHGFTYVFSLTGIFSTLAYLNILENEKILDNYPKIESWAVAVFTRLVERRLIKRFNHHGLFFNLELLNNKPLEEKFEKFLYQYGISAGLWNEGGNGLLVVIPLNAPATYFEELEFKLITALTDYRSISAVSNQI